MALFLFQKDLEEAKLHQKQNKTVSVILNSFCFLFFFAFQGRTCSIGSSQAGGRFRATAAARLYQNTMQDPSHVCNLHHYSQQHQIPHPTEQGQGLNSHPHGYQLDLFPLCHNGNSLNKFNNKIHKPPPRQPSQFMYAGS